MFNKLQLHEQENSTNKKQQSIIVVYIGLFTRSDVDANEHNKNGVFVRKTAKPTHTQKTQQIETNKPDGRGSF
jgi:hypothetical protein